MKRVIASLMFVLNIVVFGAAQNNQTTKNTVDQRLRSSGRVNPATLGMEFELPLGSYPGRGFDLPLSLSYSSKVWKFEDDHYFPSTSATPARSYVNGIYSENAAAGWTSSLTQPYIEYTGMEKYFDSHGKPYNPASPPQPPQNPSRHYIERITVFLPSGESHELRASDVQLDYPPDAAAWDNTFYATDGSGIRYVQGNGMFRLYLPDGSFYDFESGSGTSIRKATRLTDANGNFVQFNAPEGPRSGYPYGSWTDQLGRKFPIMVPSDSRLLSDGPDHVDEFHLPGMEAPYKLKWKQLGNAVFPQNSNYAPRYIGIHDSGPTPGTPLPTPSFSPLFSDDTVFPDQSCGTTDRPVHPNNSELRINRFNFGHTSTDVNGPFMPIVLAEIKLPNGAAHRFKYNEYGEIETIEYPFGGLEEFDYRKIDSLAGLAQGYQMTNRGVEERRVKESTSSSPMTYHYTADSSNDNYVTSVTAPDGTFTETFMHRGIRPLCDRSEGSDYWYRGLKWGYDSPLAGKTYETRVYSAPVAANGRLLQRTVTAWTATTPNVTAGPAPGPLLIRYDVVPTNKKYLQWNARAAVTHEITYEGDSGVAAATSFEYEEADERASPLNVTAKNEYTYVTVSDGSALLHPPAPESEDLVRRTETIYETSTTYKDRNILRLPTQVLVKDGAPTPTINAKTQMAYDEDIETLPQSLAGTVSGWSDPGTNIRGLLTTTKNWVNPANENAFVQTRVQYNAFGSPINKWDGNGNVSHIGYDDNFIDPPTWNTFAFATKTISSDPDGNGPTSPFETHTQYQFKTGLAVRTTDINGGQTAMEYNDPLLRLRKVTAPNGQQTITEYGTPASDTGQYIPTERFVKVKSQIDGNNHWEQDLTWFDGLGRTKQTKSIDNDGDVLIDTEYDNMGRIKMVSNPYRAGDALYWTENTYDALNRITKVKTTGDQAELNTDYSVATIGSQIGIVETVTDEADKTSRTIQDAFDNLIRVDEPDSDGNLGLIGSPNQPTYYTYDTNENLRQIVQGGQQRSFEYDALNRLTRATNPESGTFQYAYDPNGNLLTKIDARGISTTFTYDALNRVKVKDYSDSTPDVAFHYDAPNVQNSKSRLTKVASSVSETLFTSFDAGGNVLGSQQNINGQTYGFGYTYNLNDDLLTQTYPSGNVVRNEYDATGDLSRVKRNLTFSYAQQIKYTASGEIEQIRFGNNRWETTKFNSRRQIKEIALGYSGDETAIWKTNYQYGTWQDTTLNTQKNNGSLARQTILVPTVNNVNGFTATQTYIYDPLDRLKSATETTNGSQTWKQTFNYDRYGNKNYNTSNGNTTTLGSCAVAVCNPTANLANDNRLGGYGYDNAGNITADAEGRSFIYDAENRQITANGSNLSMSYAYDGNGERVKAHNSITNQTTYFVYDASGKLAAEYTVNVPLPDSPTISYLTNDALGSPRVITNAYGELKARRDFFPFGDEIHAGIGSRSTDQKYSASADDTRQKFATYQRDAETGLDFAQSRYYQPKHGRFTSADEFKGGPDELFDFTEDASSNPTFYADLTNPQSLNKYQYTYNNPYKYNDPTGHCPSCRWRAGWNYVKQNAGTILDGVQAVISVAGAAPVVGEVADVANAAISAARGNYGEAALDLAGAAGPVGSGVAAANRIRKIASKLNNASDTVKSAKVPNPNGKKGGPAHQKEVRKVEKNIRSRGLKSQREYMVKTPGGTKSKRFVDVVGIKGKKVVEMHQVGKRNKNGSPVSRERKADDDIKKATGKGTKFHPIN